MHFNARNVAILLQIKQRFVVQGAINYYCYLVEAVVACVKGKVVK
jgi:hypothetical protein